MCLYTKSEKSDFLYGITLFISLYGGLTIILRLVSSYLINIYFKFKYRSNQFSSKFSFSKIKQTFSYKIFLFCQDAMKIQSMKQLNLFKNIYRRTPDDIKRQRIATRTYLICLIGKMILLKNFIFLSLNQLVLIFVLCLFTSLNNGIVTTIVPKPSLTTYNSLEMIYSSTLRCPCANSTISYRRFISFLPIFHQICSSGFVQNDWISVLKSSRNGGVYYDWRNRAYIQFEILSNLCQLANETIHSVIDKFLSQLFISSSLINEEDFNQQISKYFDQFYQSTIYNFDLMKDIVQLYLQVNQFHVGVPETTETYYDPALIINIITNQTNHDQQTQVPSSL